MRLWNYTILDVLPRQQILSQLRECVAIAKSIYEIGTPNHILVNPILNYDRADFIFYCEMVIWEMKHRGYEVKDVTKQKLELYLDCKFPCMPFDGINLFKDWHNDTYLVICLYNLYEKYLCGGITNDEWDKIYHKYYKYMDYL